MGAWLSSLCAKPQYKILMVGSGGSGKTSILYRLKNGLFQPNLGPTMSFNYETLDRGGLAFFMMDTGGGDKLRPVMYIAYPERQALVFVFDCSDYQYADEAVKELHGGLAWEREKRIAPVPLLIFATKQDKEGARSTDAARQALELERITDRPYHVQGCSAVTGEGLEEGLSWLESMLSAPISATRASDVTTL